MTLLDTFSTAGFFVEQFNIKYGTRKLNISKNYLVTSKENKIENVIANFVDLGIRYAKIGDCLHSRLVIEAFMHFTYEYSRKSLIVFDLRTIGLPQENSYLLTEPIVFSTDQSRYGSSNLGESGINQFMGKHKCNEYCEYLNLKK